jgi:hypothetical protein
MVQGPRQPARRTTRKQKGSLNVARAAALTPARRLDGVVKHKGGVGLPPPTATRLASGSERGNARNTTPAKAARDEHGRRKQYSFEPGRPRRLFGRAEARGDRFRIPWRGRGARRKPRKEQHARCSRRRPRRPVWSRQQQTCDGGYTRDHRALCAARTYGGCSVEKGQVPTQRAACEPKQIYVAQARLARFHVRQDPKRGTCRARAAKRTRRPRPKSFAPWRRFPWCRAGGRVLGPNHRKRCGGADRRRRDRVVVDRQRAHAAQAVPRPPESFPPPQPVVPSRKRPQAVTRAGANRRVRFMARFYRSPRPPGYPAAPAKRGTFCLTGKHMFDILPV